MSYFVWHLLNQDYVLRVFKNCLMRSGKKYLATKTLCAFFTLLKIETNMPPIVILKYVLNKTSRFLFNIKTVHLRSRTLEIPTILTARRQLGILIRRIISATKNKSVELTSEYFTKKNTNNSFARRLCFFILNEYIMSKVSKTKGTYITTKEEVFPTVDTSMVSTDTSLKEVPSDTLKKDSSSKKIFLKKKSTANDAADPGITRLVDRLLFPKVITGKLAFRSQSRAVNEKAYHNKYFLFRKRHSRIRFKRMKSYSINNHPSLRLVV